MNQKTMPTARAVSAADQLELPTTANLADLFGVTTRRVLYLGHQRGVQPVARIGHTFLWPAEAVESLKPGPACQPRTVTE